MLRDRLTIVAVVSGVSGLFAWGDAITSGQLGNSEDGTRFSPVQAGALTNWSTVAAGSHSLGFKTDGTLWSWGLGASGQLGHATGIVNRSSPVQIGTLTSWSSNIAAGIFHSLAIRTNGTLWSWGLGSSGQLGQATGIVNRSSPVQVGTLTGWSRVAASSSCHSLAVRTNGTLWGWGIGTSGQLGQVTAAVNRSSPTQIGTLTAWSAVFSANTYAFATRTDGTLWSWGLGTSGQLGHVTAAVSRSSPVQVGTLTGWSAATGGTGQTIALRTNGTLWSWGVNNSGELGQSDVLGRSSPTQIGTLTNWSGVSASLLSAVASRTDGTLWSWGSATVGQLGDGAKINRSSPTQIGTLTVWSTAAFGVTHAVSVRTDGTLWCWGSTTSGELGNLEDGTRFSPVFLGISSDNWKNIAATTSHSVAVKRDGTLWAWGSGANGVLGQVTSIVNQSSPVQIGTLTGWSEPSIGLLFSLANRTDGSLWAWGLGTNGVLGQTTNTTTTSSPVQIGTLTSWNVVTGGGSHVVAIKTDSTLWAWGLSTNGQLGQAAKISRSSPVQIGTLTEWALVSGGLSHTHGVKTDGTLWAWGLATAGQLGNLEDGTRFSPIQIGAATDWSVVDTNNSHSAAIKTDGTLWAWGLGTAGQLGQVTAIVNLSSPTQIGTLTNWSTVSVSSTHSLALKTDGTLWAWGTGTSGQLGQVTVIVNRSSPAQVGTLTGWSTVCAGQSHSVATRTDGTLWAWGLGTSGELGQVTAAVSRSSPTQIGTLTAWSVVDGGNFYTLALRTNGTMWSWGVGGSGQLGEVTGIASRSSPIQIGTLTSWSSIVLNFNHAMARKTDNTLWVWGLGTSGQLGQVTAIVNRSSPTQIGTLTTWSSLAVGTTHSLAVRTNGTLWAWGIATSGQVGDSTKLTRSSPVQIGTLTGWASVAGGASHSVARRTDGTIWAWGQTTIGQLGNLEDGTRFSPIQIGTLTNWAMVTSNQANSYTHARKTDGTLWAWGDAVTTGVLGQVTDIANRSSPVQIGTLTNWSNIVGAGVSHVLAVKTNGSIWAWGTGTQGQVGDSAKVGRSSPVQIGTLTGWTHVSGGGSHSIALRTI